MGTHVLLVDDDDGVRETVYEAIRASGFDVLAVRNGAEALESMRRDRPELVLLDLMMPVMNGWQVLEAMQADPELACVPVWVLTLGRQKPSVPTMRKPVPMGNLLSLVGQYCRSRLVS